MDEDVLKCLSQVPDTTAKQLENALEMKQEHSIQIVGTLQKFLQSYRKKPQNQSNTEWLIEMFQRHTDSFQDESELERRAKDITNSIEAFEVAQASLENVQRNGHGTSSTWLAEQIERGTMIGGSASIGEYASAIDMAIDAANKLNIETVTNLDGSINMNPNLNGFIAQSHHINTFNMDAAVKDLRNLNAHDPTKAGTPYGKNSVDVIIQDRLATGSNKVVARHQLKYGKNAQATESMFRHGDYSFQQKGVPSDQVQLIPNGTDRLRYGGAESQPYSQKESKVSQKQIQQGKLPDPYEWNTLNQAAIMKQIGKRAAIAATLAVGFQGARILGRRVWNWARGKENHTVETDLQEFVISGLTSGGGAGIAVAITGGMTIIIRNGWLGTVLRYTPPGYIANAVCIGVEGMKTLWKLGLGELNPIQAMDAIGNSTCALLGGIAAGGKGAVAGVAIGAALGPVGIIIGGVTGGVLAGIAGSGVASAVYEGGKKIVAGVCQGVKSTLSGVSRSIKSLFSW